MTNRADIQLVEKADELAANAAHAIRLALEQMETAAALIVNASGRVPGVPMPCEHRAARYIEAATEIRDVLDRHYPEEAKPEPAPSVSVYDTDERPDGFVMI